MAGADALDFSRTDGNMTEMDTHAANRPFRIGLLLVEGFALMSFASVVEPLRAANLLAGRTLYALSAIPAAGEAATSSAGTVVPAQGRVGEAPAFDLVMVVAGGDPAAFHDRRAIAWLRRAARTGVTLGGVSGGPVILARAGLMAGRRMTVHWEHAAALAETVPGLMLERTLYVIDRDRVTCAGGTAPMDLMHALIAGHHGAAFARRVSDWFLHTDVRPAAGAQRAGLMERVGTANRAVLDAVTAMESHIGDPLDLGQLARAAGVGPRQLNRLFREKLGLSTMAFYRRLRLETARNLMRNAPLAVTEVALATGFASSAHFSRACRSEYGAPPSRLRR
jgi:AraC family transcriptional regulator, glycine betaine-responsive activator